MYFMRNTFSVINMELTYILKYYILYINIFLINYQIIIEASSKEVALAAEANHL